jgi:phosphoglycolate phosphatase
MNPRQSTRAIFFDLDGTLIDSFPGIASAYRVVFDALNLDAMTDEDIRQFIGPPIQEVLRRHFGLRDQGLSRGIQIFRDHYGTKGLFEFSKYAGIDDMLLDLTLEGYELYIATSKLRTMATQILEHAGWIHLFRRVGGAELDGSRFLKEDVIGWLVADIPVSTDIVAMVGDRAADISGGHASGLASIGVEWGYGSKQELVDAGAMLMISSPSELVAAVYALRSNGRP